MANISVGGQPIFTDNGTTSPRIISIEGIAGYDLTWVNYYESLVKARNHSFTVYNSAGTAIKTIYFID